MRFLTTFQFYDFLDTLISLATAFVLGALIGAERQYRQRTAGLRTNVLVAVGAAAFVDIAQRIGGANAAVTVIAYVVSGIGFLGAGVIMQEGLNVRGLNTAATLWCSAAVGASAGAGESVAAISLCVIVVGTNLFLRPLVRRLNTRSLTATDVETYYTVEITCRGAEEKQDILAHGMADLLAFDFDRLPASPG